MTWYNPKTWFAKPAAPPCVYISIILDKPFQGIHEREPARPFLKVNGIDLALAARLFPGKGFDWHTLPMAIREKLEMDPWGYEIEWVELKGMV